MPVRRLGGRAGDAPLDGASSGAAAASSSCHARSSGHRDASTRSIAHSLLGKRGSRTVTGSHADSPRSVQLVGTLAPPLRLRASSLTFLVAASRDLGRCAARSASSRGASVAFVAEFASTRIGHPVRALPLHRRHARAGALPGQRAFFDSLSFTFLAYAAFCLARWALGERRGLGAVVLARGSADDAARRRHRSARRARRPMVPRPDLLLPGGGLYFGVPLSNFGGWVIVGRGDRRRLRSGDSPDPRDGRDARWPGVGLYYAVLVFNLAVTVVDRRVVLLAAGILVHVAAFCYCVACRRPAARGPRRRAARAAHSRAEGVVDHGRAGLADVDGRDVRAPQKLCAAASGIRWC